MFYYEARSVHVVACISIIQYYGWIVHCLGVAHSSLTDGYLWCIHFLAIMKNTIMCIQGSVWTCVLGYIPRNGIAGSFVTLYLAFWELPNFPHQLPHFTFPPALHRVSIVILICISLMTYDVEHLFMCLLPFVCLSFFLSFFFLRNVYSNPLPIL